MNARSVALKPGVLFLPTLSGAVLMDIPTDRFIRLTPLSAEIWSSLASGQDKRELVEKLARIKSICSNSAEALLTSQLTNWANADLLNEHQHPIPLPKPLAPSSLEPAELSFDVFRRERFVPWLAGRLVATEWKYRRTIAKQGLARALVSLQSEHGTANCSAVIARVVRNYHALRRAFRQGNQARDCLFRSLALAAVLRRQGVRADLCIGIIDMPFSSHAWVEADGCVLNESLGTCKRYAVIGRF